MVAVYVVMGGRNTRKSSTIRALTGVRQRSSRWAIATNAGPIEAYVQMSALQEEPVDAAAFVARVAESGRLHVLLPLWLSPGNELPSGERYLEYFLGANWTIEQVVVLGAAVAPPLPPGVPTPNMVPDSGRSPSNDIASRVRGWWGWL